MKRNERFIHFIFWIMALVCCAFWVNERIGAFEVFTDHYKNIGYIINTNVNQLSWYILVCFFKAAFLLVLLYQLIPRFGFSRTTIYRTIFWLIIAMSMEYVVARLYFAWVKPGESLSHRPSWSYDFWSIFSIYFVLLGIGYTLSAARNWIVEYRNLSKLYQSQKSYKELKKQINPHFLFNTINSFYEVTVTEGNEKLQNGLIHLTKSLRYAIESSGYDQVPLSNEVEAIQCFIELQKERFEQGEVELTSSFEMENPDAKITPQILLNFVENAFIHGYRYGKTSVILINLSEKNHHLQLKIQNTDHARRKNEYGGNETTKKILEFSYPGVHKLKVNKNEHFYNTNLWIQLK